MTAKESVSHGTRLRLVRRLRSLLSDHEDFRCRKSVLAESADPDEKEKMVQDAADDILGILER